MRQRTMLSAIVLAVVASTAFQYAPQVTQAAAAPYSVLRTKKVGGAGGFDYVYADAANRRLYIPRSGAGARVTVWNLDNLDSAGTILNTSARGAAVDPKSNHGFASSKPVAMWDAKTLAPIKTIDVQGGPDGILFDAFNDQLWVWSHSPPYGTVINTVTGMVVGTVDIGGAPEQSVSDGKGRLYVDIEDKDSIAVIDTKTLKVLAKYTLGGKGGTPAGLAFDVKNNILFVACRNPATFVIMNALNGNILATLPIGTGTDGAVFNPATMEAFSSNGGDGTLSIIKEISPTNFVVEQTLTTTRGAKTLTLDPKTNNILLIAAEYAPPAAPATVAAGATPPPAGRAGRAAVLPESFTIWVVGKK